MARTNEDTLLDLLRTHGPALRRIADAYAAWEGEAEDLHQEILLQLWRSLPSRRGDSAAGTWAYRVALNTALGWRRSSDRRRQRQPGPADLPASTPPAERSESALLREFLASLGETDRTVLILYMEGLTSPDIADVVGVSAGAVAVRIHRMKQKFEHSFVER